jgi:hypothetical protein
MDGWCARLLFTNYRMQKAWIGGLSASPDDTRIIYGRGDASSDLMMIENFR